MRVLHVSSGNLYGGVETLLVTLARSRHLCPDMEPHFALCFEGRLSEELRTAGVPFYFLGNVHISRPWTIWRARRKLRAILSHLQFDAVICHMSWSLAIFGSAPGASTQLVFWMHGWASGFHWLDRWAKSRKPNLAICSSGFTASALPNLFPDMPARVIHYPVALRRDTLIHNIREQLNIPGNAVVIVQVSRMESWKGHLIHLQALTRLADSAGLGLLIRRRSPKAGGTRLCSNTSPRRR